MDHSLLTVQPLVEVLDQIVRVIRDLGDETYTVQPSGPFEANIAGHVRHSLDHVQALLNGIEGSTVRYDARRRGTDVETNRSAALAAIEGISQTLNTLEPQRWDQPLEVHVMLTGDAGGGESKVASTLGRELAFVLSHTIHHNAMIGAMAKALGADVPQWFGYAPSTIAHIRQNECAR